MTLLKPSEAAKFVAQETGDDPPHVATIFRWMQRGLNGVRLRFVCAHNSRRTTAEWIRQFFAEVAAAQTSGAMSTPSEVASSAVRSAERELEKAGI